jgi:acyl-CoA reductase-like NAD-dependent aldehyde dehydrogenase
MRCAQEEIFGPVIVVARFSDETDALRQANDIPFGLGAAVWTRDVARAHRVAERIESGMVWVNDHHRTSPSMPWGGVKDSGFGKQSGREAYDTFTTVKAIIVRTAPDPVDWYGSDEHDRLN